MMEPAQLRNAFDSKAQAWDDYMHTPIGRLREELTLRLLGRHLPEPTRSTSVLDAGGGTGGLALALARRGYHVHLLDFAKSMLDVARSRARRSDLLEYHAIPVEEVDQRFAPESFDVIVCHTLIEYVPNPDSLLRRLAALLKPGGLFSLEYVNRHAEALRLALVRAQLREARAALDGAPSQADLFGVPRRAFDREEAQSMLRAAALDPIAEYGVRIFADYLSDAGWQADESIYAELASLEEAAAAQEPYRSIARYGLNLARARSRTTSLSRTTGPAGARRDFWI